MSHITKPLYLHRPSAFYVTTATPIPKYHSEEETVKILIASFSHNEAHSLTYRTYRTPKGALDALTEIIHRTQADYVSVRIIRTDKPNPGQLKLPQ